MNQVEEQTLKLDSRGSNMYAQETLVSIDDVAHFDKAVREASKELVNELNRIGKPAKNVFLDRIKSLVDG